MRSYTTNEGGDHPVVQMRRTLLCWVLCGMIGGAEFFVAPVRADEVQETFQLFEEEEQVVTSGRRPQNASEIPASVKVFTAEDIHRMGARTLADVLRFVPGMDVRVSNDSALEQVRVDNRGLGGSSTVINKRILLLVDGRPANSYWYGNFHVDERLALNHIRRIEIIKGPASSLYGTNAMDGVINIITKDAETSPGVHLSAGGGSYGTHFYAGEFGHRIANTPLSMFASGRVHQSAGPALVNRNESRYAGNVFTKLSAGPAVLSMGYDQAHLQYSGSLSTPTANGSVSPRDSFADLKASLKIAERFSVQPRVYWNYYQDELNSIVGPATDRQKRNEYRLGGEIQTNWNIAQGYDLVTGIEGRQNWGSITYLGTHEATEKAAYTQIELGIIPRVRLLFGGRLDSNSASPTFFSPRAGIVYRIAENWTAKGSYGRAFRSPNFSELFANFQNGVGPTAQWVVANPGLDPEKIQTFEGILEYRSKTGVRANVAYFYNKIEDLIALRLVSQRRQAAIPDALGRLPNLVVAQIINSGSADIWGVESEVEAVITSWLKGFANYSYQNTDSNSITSAATIPTNKPGELVYAPPHKANAGVTIEPVRWAHWSVQAHYVDARRRFFSVVDRIPPWAEVDTLLGVNVGSWGAYVAFYNILGKYYEQTSGVPMPGASVQGGVEYRF